MATLTPHIDDINLKDLYYTIKRCIEYTHSMDVINIYKKMVWLVVLALEKDNPIAEIYFQLLNDIVTREAGGQYETNRELLRVV